VEGDVVPRNACQPRVEPVEVATVPPPRPGPALPPTVFGGTAAPRDRYEAREKGLARFCAQCDRLIGNDAAARCESRFCSLRKVAA